MAHVHIVTNDNLALRQLPLRVLGVLLLALLRHWQASISKVDLERRRVRLDLDVAVLCYVSVVAEVHGGEARGGALVAVFALSFLDEYGYAAVAAHAARHAARHATCDAARDGAVCTGAS